MHFKLLPEVSLKLLCYKNLFDNYTEFELDQLFEGGDVPCDILNFYNDIQKYKTIRNAIRANRLDLVVYFHIMGELIVYYHQWLAIELNMTDIGNFINEIYVDKPKTNNKLQLNFNHPIKELDWALHFNM
jgi:hypothetical protein